MPVSKHKKKSRRDRRKEKSGPVLVKHPLSDVPRDVLAKALIATAAASSKDFPNQLNELVAAIHSVDPLQLLATLAQYGLMGHVTEDGKVKPSHRDEEFTQSHVELVQAIALQLPEDITKPPPPPEKIQKLFDLLPGLGRAYSNRRMANLDSESTREQTAIRALQEHLRLHTQVVRNWGYFDRVVRITSELCRPIDEVLRKAVGISGTELIKVFLHFVREREGRINQRLSRLRASFNEPTVDGMVRKYYESNPQLRDRPSELIDFVHQQCLKREQVKFLLLFHSDLSLAEAYFIDVSAAANEAKVSDEALRTALDRLSLQFGELGGTDCERLFLDNPVWLRPLIKCRGERYFCPLPQVFFGFVFPILDHLLSRDSTVHDIYARRRADFLEAEVKRVFRTGFPECRMWEKVKWREGDDEFENDLLVQVDSHLIIVEAKSGSVSWPALRGAPGRAKRHVEELILAPSFQSYRLMKRLLQVMAQPERAAELLPQCPIDLTRIKNVLRVSVTLEDFAVVQTNLGMAREAGWTTAEHPIAPCILLSDLEIVFDVLDLTALKIHYLKRRAEIQENLKFHGDELDLLGLYLATGFNIGETEFDGTRLQLVLMSKPIDEYYIALAEGIQRPKPRPKLTQLWRDICACLQERSFYQWSDVAVVLLAFSYDDQRKMEKYFSRIRKNVHKNWRQPHHQCSVNIIPNRQRSDALSFYAFRERQKENRRESMQNIAGQAFESEHVMRCVILAVNIDRDDYPYSTLMVFFRDGPEPAAATR